MKPAANIMKDKIANTKFNNPLFEIVNNVTAKPEIKSENIKELLVKQISSTVKWRDSIINMSNAGIKNYIEIGPGKVLTGMVKEPLNKQTAFQLTL